MTRNRTIRSRDAQSLTAKVNELTEVVNKLGEAVTALARARASDNKAISTVLLNMKQDIAGMPPRASAVDGSVAIHAMASHPTKDECDGTRGDPISVPAIVNNP